ncbi:MAG: helix-turn-helix domain-containing protein [Pseudonocardia sp.]
MEDRTVGQRLRAIRRWRRKSLRVIAELAGISESYLSLLERDKRVLDRRSLIVDLANALQVSPSELMQLSVPAPSDGYTDAAIDAVRGAVQAVTIGVPAGQVQPSEQLAARCTAVLDAKQRCRHAEVGMTLPALIRDLHTSIAAGRDDAALLRLATVLHPQGTQAYLHGVGAPVDLCWSAARLAGDAAETLDESVSLGIAGFGQANGLLSWGSFDLARQVLRRSDPPTEDLPLTGMLTLSESLLAAAEDRGADVDAALDQAAEIAARTGETNAHYMSFGPTNVAMWRLSVALESGDHAGAARLAEALNPEEIIAPTRRANYWVNYARAVSPMRGRQDDAVIALRRAETISADKVHRNPIALDLLVVLRGRAHRDAVGRELRGMLYRAGLGG